MKVFKRMSRQNQKLLHWLIGCYAYHLANVDITNRSAENKPKLKGAVYWNFKAKEDLTELEISGKTFSYLQGKDFKDIVDIDKAAEKVANDLKKDEK